MKMDTKTIDVIIDGILEVADENIKIEGVPDYADNVFGYVDIEEKEKTELNEWVEKMLNGEFEIKREEKILNKTIKEIDERNLWKNYMKLLDELREKEVRCDKKCFI